MKQTRKLSIMLAVLLLLSLLTLPAFADKASFEYKLTVTDQNGAEVVNPRAMKAGDTLNIEIELTRTDTNAASYETYGLEFRLRTFGLEYNNDGASFRNNTKIMKQIFINGDSVGFAYYDMQQVGERINNPVLAGKWSYTVSNPKTANILVPVALMYVVHDSESYIPVGNARLFLDPDGGKIIGEDLSGEYRSGTILTLPDAKLADYKFLGWSDGADLYPPGSNYTVSGIVTLTAVWEGLERNRQITVDLQGGTLEGEDFSGMYADGEKLILPNVTREGYRLLGWSDGVNTYQPGDEYEVYNSVVMKPVWEEITEPTAPTEPTLEPVPTGEKENPDADDSGPGWLWWLLGALAACGLGWWLWLILWKRRWVLYSLKTGDVALSYKNKDHDYEVEVVLRTEDEDGNRVKYSLNKSGTVEKDKKLRFIHGQPELYPIVEIEPGKYKGYLRITGGEGEPEEQNVRIKVLDRELRERKNDE